MLLVQRTDPTTEQEVLVLLHYAGEVGFTRAELGRHAQVSIRSVGRALEALPSPRRREVVALCNRRYRLTDLGAHDVREHLADKLLIAEAKLHANQ